MKARASLVAAGVLLALALTGASAVAAETERVADGGFEETTCASPSSCTNSNWSTADVQGRFCSAGSGTNCTGPAATGIAFGRLGYLGYSNISPVFNSGRIEQTVLVPEAPAQLSYRLRFNEAPFANADLVVGLAGNADRCDHERDRAGHRDSRREPSTSLRTSARLRRRSPSS